MAENNEMEMDELDNIIELTDENGEAVQFELLDVIKFENDDYAVMFPADEEDNDDEVIILKIQEDPEDEENEFYVSVDDEETLTEVFNIFKEKFKDEFDFVD